MGAHEGEDALQFPSLGLQIDATYKIPKLAEGSKFMNENSNEFYKLWDKDNLEEDMDQFVGRYINGLRQSIPDHIYLFDLARDDAHR